MNKKLLNTVFVLTSFGMQAQCTMCRAVLESGGEKVAEGINNGIVYLMAFPYLFAAIGLYFLYRS